MQMPMSAAAGVKEAAAWCLGYMASHNTELAQQVGSTQGGLTQRHSGPSQPAWPSASDAAGQHAPAAADQAHGSSTTHASL